MSISKSTFSRWDIFCSVVDNYGDIGICWRVARQLVAEHGQQVRLWVDDLHSFQRINPEIDPEQFKQFSNGVEICHWRQPFTELTPEEIGDVVIEALACTLPAEFIGAMVARNRKPVWINLEYLSAESWVDGCHGMASPQLPLMKYFFFPGFSPATGGLLRERQLLSQRRAFQADHGAQTTFWQNLGVPPRRDQEFRLSLFGYDTPAIAELVPLWIKQKQSVRCLIPEGKLAQQVAAALGQNHVQAGDCLTRDNLTIHVLPFLEQDQYDRLLWACDLNFVRGEDSFVRAQWAGKPLVWQAYRQDEDTHLVKLDAFLQRYCEDLPSKVSADLRAFWFSWNRGVDLKETWPAFFSHQRELSRYSEEWIKKLLPLGDTVTNLVLFCKKYL